MYSVGCPRREMELTPCPQARTGPLAADARIAGTGVPGNGRQRGRRLHWRFHCGGTGAFGTSVLPSAPGAPPGSGRTKAPPARWRTRFGMPAGGFSGRFGMPSSPGCQDRNNLRFRDREFPGPV